MWRERSAGVPIDSEAARSAPRGVRLVIAESFGGEPPGTPTCFEQVGRSEEPSLADQESGNKGSFNEGVQRGEFRNWASSPFLAHDAHTSVAVAACTLASRQARAAAKAD